MRDLGFWDLGFREFGMLGFWDLRFGDLGIWNFGFCWFWKFVDSGIFSLAFLFKDFQIWDLRGGDPVIPGSGEPVPDDGGTGSPHNPIPFLFLTVRTPRQAWFGGKTYILNWYHSPA